MQFRVLGALEVLDASGRPLVLTGAKERSLLAALLINPGEVVSTDRLCEILWPDAPPSNPTNALQARVSALRRALGEPDVIVTQSPGYRLSIGAEDVDATRFEALLGEARKTSKAGLASAIEVYDRALELWRGTPFADFVYQDFARPEISRLEELWLAAKEERIQVMLDVGRHSEVLGDLDALVVEYPLRERFWGQLMLALYRSGRQADALRAFQEASKRLGEDLGIEPSLELRQLEDAILTQDSSLAGPSGKDTAPDHNLPARLTSLVGRSTDIERVVGLLADQRLITLTGPGGVGKSSLAVACGQEALAGFDDGVWLVELAAVSDPGLVPVEIVRSLRLEVGDRSTLDVLCEVLRDRNLLVLIDNCEHLVDAVAGTVAAILQRARHVRIIATSREPLAVTGEILWPTRPLSVPSGTADEVDLEGYDAVKLFVERARAVDPDFNLDTQTAPAVVEICSRLDGLPLALELAAARVRNLPVAEIAARLGDRFRLLTGTARTVLPRQQTLEATIAWSYELLPEDEKRLFRRLSVFAGGWTLAAAEGVGPNPDRVLDLLARLVDRSLVVTDHAGDVPRFFMLETIRDFAARELAESGEEKEAALRHAGWFLALAESAELQGPGQSGWAKTLSTEHENLRAAVIGALHHGEPETALRLGGALGWWWFFGNRDEGRAVLDQLLAATSDSAGPDRVSALQARVLLDLFGATPHTMELAAEAFTTALALDDAGSAARAKVFVALGGVFGPAIEPSLALLDEALGVFRESRDVWSEGFARFQRMEVVGHKGDLRAAIDEGQASLALMQKTGDPWAISAALAHLGRYGRLTGRVEWAKGITEQALEVAKERGLPHTVQYVMTDQAYLHLLCGDPEQARRLFTEALEIALEVGNQVGVASIHNGLAESYLASGAVEEAGRLHREAAAQFEAIGLRTAVAYTVARLGLVEECSQRWEKAAVHYNTAHDAAITSADVIDLIPCLEGLGRTLAARGEMARSARLLRAGSTLRERTGLAPLPVEEAATRNAETVVGSALAPQVLEAIATELRNLEPTAMASLAG